MDALKDLKTFNGHHDIVFYRNLTAVYFLFYAVIKTIFIFSGYDLFSEEAQYWLWSRYPDWSYYSKPPLIAWINYATGLIGHHDSIIRLTALAFGMAMLYGMYKVTLLLFQQKRMAYLSTILLSVSPYFILVSTFFTTDSLLLFFWVATGYYFIKAVQNNAMADWFRTGLFFGLGCLSKYTMFFFLFALIPLFVVKEKKRYRKGILAFLMIGIVMFLPVIIWNYQHDWVTIKHVFALSGGGTTHFTIWKSLTYLSEFMGGVLLINSPFLLYIVFRRNILLKTESWKGIPDAGKLAWLMLPVAGTISIFFVISILKRTEVNWGAMSYLSLPVILAYITERTNSYAKTLTLSALTFVVILLLLFPLTVDRLGVSNILPISIDSMKRMAGWKQLSNTVCSLQKQYPVPPLIITDNYHIASEISFYGGFDSLYCLNSGRRMNQFDIWGGLKQRNKQKALYITELTQPSRDALNFKNIEAQWTFPVIYRGKVIRTFNIFILNDFTGEAARGFNKF